MLDFKEHVFFDNTPFKLTFFFEICYILIPLIILLILCIPSTLPIFSLHMICVGIIGSYDTLLKYNKDKYGIVPTIISLLFHSILLVGYKYLDTGIASLGLLLFALYVIYKIPYWPYEISRMIMAKLYVSIYVGAYVLNRLMRLVIS